SIAAVLPVMVPLLVMPPTTPPLATAIPVLATIVPMLVMPPTTVAAVRPCLVVTAMPRWAAFIVPLLMRAPLTVALATAMPSWLVAVILLLLTTFPATVARPRPVFPLMNMPLPAVIVPLLLTEPPTDWL